MNDNIFVVIPTLNPNIQIFEAFLDNLLKETKNILVINDGCRKEYNDFFKKIEKKGIIVLHHYINLGKGRAMKDAFNYLLNTYPKLKGVVTADSDGQHSIKDIKKVASEIERHPNSLILGCRNFDSKNVPTRNKFGNKITRRVFKLFIGLSITDTQTGLRGYPKDVMVKFIDTLGERFEYETNMLIETINKNVPIYEVDIETIYISGNSESHFNPIKDSISIYKLFLKYIFASISSFVVDILFFSLFWILFKFNYNILLATICARVISSLYNYMVNAKLVFKKENKTSFIKYVLLVIIQMFVSGLTVEYLATLISINPTLIKIVVDLVIFVVNFIIQRELIFIGEKS
ncbi:MAG: glycosyltransferase [Mollicutes bacterium]|nr:glycosyltransferase [Mollicutes bacterium]